MLSQLTVGLWSEAEYALINQGFWNQSVLACRACGNYGNTFKALRGVTQGGLVLPKIFNMLVDAVICEWLRRMFGYKVAQLGIGTTSELVRTFLVIFYTDNGYMASRDP